MPLILCCVLLDTSHIPLLWPMELNHVNVILLGFIQVQHVTYDRHHLFAISCLVSTIYLTSCNLTCLYSFIHAMLFNSITCKAFMSDSTWLGAVGDDPLPSSMRLNQRLVDRQPNLWCDPFETLEIVISYFSFFGVYIGNISFGLRLLAFVFIGLYFVM